MCKKHAKKMVQNISKSQKPLTMTVRFCNFFLKKRLNGKYKQEPMRKTNNGGGGTGLQQRRTEK